MSIEDIATYRAKIDAIDDTLIDLLKKRSAWVRKVGTLKTSHQEKGMSFIRAGREAMMVRRIYDAFADESFPPEAAASIWRIIISASLSLESTLNVMAFAPPDNTLLYWLAKEYFGSFSPVLTGYIPAHVIDAVSVSQVQVGVLPIPSAVARWWLDLPEKICVFACLPFVINANEAIEGLGIAHLVPEPTDDDVTLLRVHAVNSDLAHRLKSFGTILDSATLSENKNYACLLQVDGFHYEDNMLAEKIKTLPGISIIAIHQLGAYAKPIITKGHL